MRFATRLRTAAEWITGWYIRKYPPLGLDKFHDMGAVWPAASVRTVLDVGANIGQSAVEFRKQFPQADVHCFEPVPTTFSTLKGNVVGERFSFHCIALGSTNERIAIQVTNDEARSDMNSLKGPHPYLRTGSFRTEEIEVMRLDDWCHRNNITTIDYLKIDTEGHDFEVLKGAENTLRDRRVRCLEVEVSMNPGNTFHVPFQTVAAHLAGYGYHLFGLYEQLHEDPVKRPVLRRVNAVFTAVENLVTH